MRERVGGRPHRQDVAESHGELGVVSTSLRGTSTKRKYKLCQKVCTMLAQALKEVKAHLYCDVRQLRVQHQKNARHTQKKTIYCNRGMHCAQAEVAHVFHSSRDMRAFSSTAFPSLYF